jgi:RNA polymerase sigma factor (sigma-70 family)
LTCIVLNACIDAGRRERRRPAEPLELAGDDGCQEEGTLQRSLADPSPSPEECAASSEAAAALESALEQLAGIHREVVELDRGGYSYREIAARTGLPIGTVRSRLSRARARLRAALAPELLWRVLGIPVR